MIDRIYDDSNKRCNRLHGHGKCLKAIGSGRCCVAGGGQCAGRSTVYDWPTETHIGARPLDAELGITAPPGMIVQTPSAFSSSAIDVVA